MTIQAAHDYLDLLLDKIESAYFTDDEKDSLLTQACIEYVKRMLPSAENQGANFELDQINYNNLYTLVHTTGSTTMNGSGIITVSAVQTLLNTASGSTEPFMAILGVNWARSGSNLPVKWTRHNNYFKDIRNPFKIGNSTEPIYKYDKTNFTFYPVDTNATITFSLLKQPKATSLSGGTTIELPDHVHKSVVELAVDLASVALREGDLRALNSNQ